MTSHQMIESLKSGATDVTAATSHDYDACTEWLCENGGEFRYHFETGEAFSFNGRVVEVFGL